MPTLTEPKQSRASIAAARMRARIQQAMQRSSKLPEARRILTPELLESFRLVGSQRHLKDPEIIAKYLATGHRFYVTEFDEGKGKFFGYIETP